MFFRSFITALCFCAGLPAAALEIVAKLETPGGPHPNRLYLNMTGKIGAGDAKKLESGLAHYDHIDFRELVIYLDSLGGSLAEAMDMAEILRSRPELVRTHVGGLDDAPSDCASACVFVFAAGKLRYLADNGRIGVHQFFSSDPDLTGEQALSLGQALSSDVVMLLDNQGISTDFFEQMAYTPAEGITWVGRRQLEDWRVVTGDVFEESIEYINVNGRLSLQMQHRSIYGDNAITLTCNKRHEIVGVANLAEPAGVSGGEFYAVIDGVPASPESYSIISSENDRTQVVFKLAAYQARLLASAGSFGVHTTGPRETGFWGFEQQIRTPRVRELVNGCGGGNAVQTGLRTERGIDLHGSDLYPDGIRNVTFQTCVKACADEARCVGVSYVESKNWCWPKSSASGRRPAAGITSALKP